VVLICFGPFFYPWLRVFIEAKASFTAGQEARRSRYLGGKKGVLPPLAQLLGGEKYKAVNMFLC